MDVDEYTISGWSSQYAGYYYYPAVHSVWNNKTILCFDCLLNSLLKFPDDKADSLILLNTMSGI